MSSLSFKSKAIALCLSLLVSGLSLSFAADNGVNLPVGPNAGKPQPVLMIPQPPVIDAKGYIMIDANSGQLLAANNADLRMPPASLTKLMTLYISFSALSNKQISLDDSVPISKKAWQTQGSRMFVKAGDNVPVRDLIQGIIVDSGNDATVAMAEFIGGSEDSFTDLMNQQAARLGMKNTNFTDSNGLPHPNHYSSPHDMAILARAIITEFPQYYKGFSQKEFTYAGITQHNRNRLLWRYPSTDGLKTGHTDEAGFCLVSSAKQGDTRFIVAVFGAPSDNARAEDSQNLLTYGARFYETKKLYAANQNIADLRIWEGDDPQLAVGLSSDLYLTIPVGHFGKIKTETLLPRKVNAPIQKGQVLGKLSILLDGKPIAEKPLVALKDDPLGGMWTRLSDAISERFHGLWGQKEET